jgi:hypothetical protein
VGDREAEYKSVHEKLLATWNNEFMDEIDRTLWMSPEEYAADKALNEAKLMTPGYCTEAWLKQYVEVCGPTEAFKRWYQARQ